MLWLGSLPGREPDEGVTASARSGLVRHVGVTASSEDVEWSCLGVRQRCLRDVPRCSRPLADYRLHCRENRRLDQCVASDWYARQEWSRFLGTDTIKKSGPTPYKNSKQESPVFDRHTVGITWLPAGNYGNPSDPAVFRDFSFSTYRPTTVRRTMWPFDLDIWLSVMRVFVLRQCIPSLKLVGLSVRKILRIYSVSINWPGDLDLWPFDL